MDTDGVIYCVAYNWLTSKRDVLKFNGSWTTYVANVPYSTDGDPAAVYSGNYYLSGYGVGNKLAHYSPLTGWVYTTNTPHPDILAMSYG